MERRKKKEEVRKNELRKLLNQCIRKYDLTEAFLDQYESVYQKNYSHLISSNQAQAEKARVFQGVCEVLYGNRDESYQQLIKACLMSV